MSDTPRSDATPHNAANLGMLCRTLERELNEAKDQIEKDFPPEPEYTAWVEAGKPDISKVVKERDEARKEVDRLREELESHSFDLSPAMVQTRNDQLNEQLDEARKSLLECMEYVWCKDGRCGTRYDETAWPEEYDRWCKAAGLENQ